MYENLIEELQDAFKTATKLKVNPYRLVPYYQKAADAIEDLSKQLAYYHRFDGFLMAHGMFDRVEWTPAEYELSKKEE